MPAGSNSEMKINSDKTINIDSYRKLVKSYIDLQMYPSALFWADKVVSLSEGEPRDVFWLAQCMYLMKQYHRAAVLIQSRQLEKTHLICRYLAAKCLLEAREYKDALTLLNGEDNGSGSILVGSMTSILDFPDTPLEGFSTTNLHSAILYLKGCVYEALDNRSLASDCYKQALRCDIHCYDAFQALVQHQMLPSWEEKDLTSTLPFAAQCKTKDEEWLVRSLYDSLLKKYQSVPSRAVIQVHSKLEGNLDLEVAKAERHYYACAYTECLTTTQSVLDKDPYHMSCLPIHVACLVELKKGNALFYLAHNLVDRHPDLAVSWFAVGCYYYLKGNTDPARRYLGKATSLDRVFGPAWLVYGHSFAVENEHDQAMAAYFKASQLMKGCHLPLLYIGLECGLTNNIKLAEKFFIQAQTIAPHDPFVIHEMGVVAYQNNDFDAAETLFEEALIRVKEIDDVIIADKWESLLNNLGHTCRKLKKYEKALTYHKKALVLSPLSPSTLASIGFVQALIGQTSEAVESFHKALSLRRDDTFSTSMLTFVMEQLVAEAQPFQGEEVSIQVQTIGKGSKEEDSAVRTSPGPNSPQVGQRSDEMDVFPDSFQDENNT